MKRDCKRTSPSEGVAENFEIQNIKPAPFRMCMTEIWLSVHVSAQAATAKGKKQKHIDYTVLKRKSAAIMITNMCLNHCS